MIIIECFKSPCMYSLNNLVVSCVLIPVLPEAVLCRTSSDQLVRSHHYIPKPRQCTYSLLKLNLILLYSFKLSKFTGLPEGSYRTVVEPMKNRMLVEIFKPNKCGL